jgi:putative ABC transport system substrate-binding protein
VGSKRLELLHLLVPKAIVIGMLVNPNYDADVQVRDLQAGVVAIGEHLRVAKASTEHDIDTAFAILPNKA